MQEESSVMNFKFFLKRESTCQMERRAEVEKFQAGSPLSAESHLGLDLMTLSS